MRVREINFLIITALTLSFGFVTAEVVQHDQDYNISASDDGKIHYFGKLSDWDKWVSNGQQNYVSLDKNPIYTALSIGMGEQNVQPPTLAESQSVLGEAIGFDFHDLISKREVIEKDKISADNAIVYSSKISSVVDSNIENFKVDESKFLEIMNIADAPHKHIRVDKDFVRNSIEGVHTGHDKLDDKGITLFSFIGFLDYGCEFLLNSLAGVAQTLGESVRTIVDERGEVVPAFNIHLLSTLKRLEGSELSETSNLFGQVPDVVFVQDIIYQSFLIKAGKNYWAFFDLGNGKTRVVNYSSVALTSKAKQARKLLLTGVSATTLADAGQRVASGDANRDSKDQQAIDLLLQLQQGFDKAKENTASAPIIDYKDLVIARHQMNLVDFKPETKVCSKGLGLGIPGYTLTTYKRLISEMK